MVSGRPKDTNPDGWYAAARRIDQARMANEAFQNTRRIDPAFRPKSMPTPPPDAPPPPTCDRCEQPGHVETNCPLKFDIRHMTIEERTRAVQALLAEKLAAEIAARAKQDPEDFQ